MKALNEADFMLFKLIRQKDFMAQDIRTLRTRQAAMPTHAEFLGNEDRGVIGQNYFDYDPTLPVERLIGLEENFRSAGARNGTNIVLSFKYALQRPRPYQMATILGVPHEFEQSVTAHTAALPSGHCLQASVGAATILGDWQKLGFQPNERQLITFARFVADVGDRRVFAGLHYPSDNLASWIVALRLISRLSLPRESTSFLLTALEQSVVYKLMVSSKSVAYIPAINKIAQLAAEIEK